MRDEYDNSHLLQMPSRLNHSLSLPLPLPLSLSHSDAPLFFLPLRLLLHQLLLPYAIAVPHLSRKQVVVVVAKALSAVDAGRLAGYEFVYCRPL